jgi:L-ascorbate metabolism protein UlaG (beta-lactamase superfamily)
VKDLRLTHVGGPTVLIEVAGWRILSDPTFDAPGRHYSFGWGSGSTKLAGPALRADDMGRIDAVLVTHDHHADNLDDAGRALLADAGVVVTTVPGAKRLGRGARGLRAWDVTRLEHPDRPPIEVTATPCRHGPPLSRPITGHVIGFALRWAGQENGALWISGDTVLYPGVREVATRVDVDVALLHVGCVRFGITGPLKYTMTIDEAAELCRSVKPSLAIPVHYEGWSHFTEGRPTVDEHIDRLPASERDRFRLLPIGEPVETEALRT